MEVSKINIRAYSSFKTQKVSITNTVPAHMWNINYRTCYGSFAESHQLGFPAWSWPSLVLSSVSLVLGQPAVSTSILRWLFLKGYFQTLEIQCFVLFFYREISIHLLKWIHVIIYENIHSIHTKLQNSIYCSLTFTHIVWFLKRLSLYVK